MGILALCVSEDSVDGGETVNIGLIGKLGSGKTTAAKHIAAEYGYNRYSLAAPMREIVRIVYPHMDKKDPRYRQLMQKLGTDWFRSYDEDVWVNVLLFRTSLETHPVVVDDVRFVNEARTLLEKGWLLIYIDASDEVRKQRCIERDGHWDESVLNHSSETQIEEAAQYAQYSIDGDLELDEFLEELDEIVQRHKCAFDEWEG